MRSCTCVNQVEDVHLQYTLQGVVHVLVGSARIPAGQQGRAEVGRWEWEPGGCPKVGSLLNRQHAARRLLPHKAFREVPAQSQAVCSHKQCQAVAETPSSSPLCHLCYIQGPQGQRQVGPKAHQTRRAGGRAVRGAGLAVGTAVAAAAALQARNGTQLGKY